MLKKSHSVLHKQQRAQNDDSKIPPVCQRIGESEQGAHLLFSEEVNEVVRRMKTHDVYKALLTMCKNS